MPLNDFRCTTCGVKTESLQKSDIREIMCPQCSGTATKLLSRPGGFNLKGEGWYKGSASEPND